MTSIDWAAEQKSWAYAYGKPSINAQFKSKPSDFKVTEILPFELNGSGEHLCLKIRKTKNHTARLADALAKFSGVRRYDVSYCGRKDYFAVTEQWFSIYQPKADEIDWSNFEIDGAEILEVTRHNKKLRRGAHQANHFAITLRSSGDDLTTLVERLELIKQNGVPNYFGEQRFGRSASNMDRAAVFIDEIQSTEPSSRRKRPKRFRDRESIWLSALRAWLFNTVLSKRVTDGSWHTLSSEEPAILDGSHSFFIVKNGEEVDERLVSGDIHPTAPLWGKAKRNEFSNFGDALLDYEHSALADFSLFMNGLEQLGLEYQRRSTRSIPRDLSWQLQADKVVLEFSLLPGEYATSLLRELIQ